MINNHTAPFAYVVGALLSLALLGEQASAQSQPATVPTVVAQATGWWPSMSPKPQFFDRRLPTGWPAALVPAGTSVLGGSVVGDSGLFRVQTAVFAFSGQTNPDEVLRGLLARAGYVRPDPEPSEGGFVGNTPSEPRTKYCKGSSLATFGVVDSAQAPFAFAVTLIDGQAGRHSCTPRRDRELRHRLLIEVPTLSPPTGAMAFGQGTCGGGDGRTMRTALRTTMPADSVLAHYTAQLVSGGWRVDGKPVSTDDIGVQRFSFRDGQDDWMAALLIMAGRRPARGSAGIRETSVTIAPQLATRPRLRIPTPIRATAGRTDFRKRLAKGTRPTLAAETRPGPTTERRRGRR
jgi:hypothetical protein